MRSSRSRTSRRWRVCCSSTAVIPAHAVMPTNITKTTSSKITEVLRVDARPAVKPRRPRTAYSTTISPEAVRHEQERDRTASVVQTDHSSRDPYLRPRGHPLSDRSFSTGATELNAKEHARRNFGLGARHGGWTHAVLRSYHPRRRKRPRRRRELKHQPVALRSTPPGRF
jgi:hypothetical protein